MVARFCLQNGLIRDQTIRIAEKIDVLPMLWTWALDVRLGAVSSLPNESKDALVRAPDALGFLGWEILLHDLLQL